MIRSRGVVVRGVQLGALLVLGSLSCGPWVPLTEAEPGQTTSGSDAETMPVDASTATPPPPTDGAASSEPGTSAGEAGATSGLSRDTGATDTTGASGAAETDASEGTGPIAGSTTSGEDACVGLFPPFCDPACTYDPFTNSCVPDDEGGSGGAPSCDGLDVATCFLTAGCNFDFNTNKCHA